MTASPLLSDGEGWRKQTTESQAAARGRLARCSVLGKQNVAYTTQTYSFFAWKTAESKHSVRVTLAASLYIYLHEEVRKMSTFTCFVTAWDRYVSKVYFSM